MEGENGENESNSRIKAFQRGAKIWKCRLAFYEGYTYTCSKLSYLLYKINDILLELVLRKPGLLV